MSKTKSTISNTIFMFKSMWKFNKVLFLGRLTISILNGFIAPINAYILKVLVDNITAQNWNNTIVIVITFAVVNLLINGGILHAFINRKLGILNDLFRNYLLFDFNSKVVSMDYEVLLEPSMIQKKDMAFKTIQENRATRYIDFLFSSLSHIITLVSVLYLLSSFSWWVYLVILVISAMKIYTVIIDKKSSYNSSIQLAPINAEITYYMSMLIDESYVNDMRMFSISEWVISKYKNCIDKTHGLLKQLLSINFKNTINRSVLSAIENVFLYGFVAWQMIFNNMTFANFTLATNTLRSFADSTTGLTRSLIDISENSAYIKIYIDFMKVENKIAVPNFGIPNHEIQTTDNIFELKNVSFKYPGGNNFALNNINLNIERNKFYVIVGKNGAGKTTLMKLLCRLYDVSEGSLLYMDTNVKDIEYKSYRNNIGIVFQDYKYYNLSIAENVAMNEYSASKDVEERITNALYKAGLKDKILSLPNGIHTQLGRIFDEEGVILSGGELQKLALARVLFKDPSIVILDEPSSALDAFAENELISTFNSVLKNKTVFYISHRLSVANYADKVIYIENGEIKGFDTHKNLLNTLPVYKDMYEAQAAHYK